MPIIHDSLLSLKESVSSLVRGGDLETALEMIQAFVERIVYDSLATGRVFSSPALDELCLRLGAQVLSQMNLMSPAPTEGRIVYVATEFYRTGGHTLVAADFVRNLPDHEHVFLLTDVLGNPHRDAPDLRLVSLGAKLEIAPTGLKLEKLKWLLARISELSPERIFWFNHHQDAVAIAAALPSIPGNKYFIHHGDHNLCLGVHTPHLHHVDLANLGFFNCRDVLGIANNRYWPLACDDLGPRDQKCRFMQAGRLRTCSSGSENKFETPYLYNYVDILPRILSSTGGDHIHVGFLSEEYLGRIRHQLAVADIPQECFIHVPWVLSLWRELIEREVDVYLMSWPIGGGKALIEAMGAGIPSVIHVNYISRYHSGFDVGYADAPTWRTPAELANLLGAFTSESLASQSLLARAHYEKHHTPEILASLLRGDPGDGPAPIPLRGFQPDSLQTFLDDCAQRSSQFTNLNRAVAERDGQIASLNQAVGERDGQIASLNQAVAERDGQIASLNQAVAERDEQIASLLHELQSLQLSTTWRATAPLRWVVHQARRTNHLLKTVPSAVRLAGGVRPALAKALRIYFNEGFAGIRRGLIHVQISGQSVLAPRSGHVDRNDYHEWIKRYDTLDDAARQRIRDSIEFFSRAPRISVLMPVYDPSLPMLDEAIRSVRNQLYPGWELCIADDASKNPAVRELLARHAAEDGRIRVAYRKQNGHISAASNTSLEMATGEFVALLDHDDLLSEQALFWVAEAINRHPDARLIYSDEDKVNESGLRCDPYFKCDWNYDLFLSQNMISHLGAYEAGLLRRIGGFSEGLEGSQDYDLALRCIEQLDPSQIIHIPRVLYHWRTHPDSTALSAQAKPYAYISAERALNDHLARKGVAAQAERHPDIGFYRVRYTLPERSPLVTLIIPTRNGLQLIRQCLSSILERTDYPNYEILVVDNGSDDPQALAYFGTIRSDPRLRILRDDRPFNYSALNNRAVQVARGELVGLINNDIEVISGEWLTEMVSIALQHGVGAVGARLWYPDSTLQHGGVVLGLGGVASHSHKHLPKGHYGYFGRAVLQQTFSAVTAACLVVRRSIFLEVRGFEEKNLKVAYGDVDFCLRVREAGYRNVWTPYAELYHHESASRGFEDLPEKQARFAGEVRYMQERWGGLLMNDPAYSPNLTLDRDEFSYAWPPRVSRI